MSLRRFHPFWIGGGLVLLFTLACGGAEDEDDEASLRKAGLSSDGPALLAELHKQTLTPDKRRKVDTLIGQLGSEEFAIREEATRQLRAFGQLVLPRLRQAAKDRDAEVARRARMLTESIENGPDTRLPLAALRLVAKRKPAGAVEALLAYLPFADDEEREGATRKALIQLARHDGKLNNALRRALTDSQPKVRAAAGEALILVGGAEGRDAARALLSDEAPSVRFSVASALARTGQREGVSALIDLLPVLSAEEADQAEEILHQLAYDSPPRLPDDRKKRRAAWAAWWKVNGGRVDLRRLTTESLRGYTLICGQNYVSEVDRRGKDRWHFDTLNVVLDARMLPGERVLVVEHTGPVTERDRTGKVLWKKDGLRGSCNAQRLPNGNTFITLALENSSVVEVDRTGKEVYRINQIADLMGARRTRQGEIVCACKTQCLFLDPTGKLLRCFAVKYPLNGVGCLDVLPNDRILLASHAAGKVMEYDNQGKLLKEWNVYKVTTATGLPNGHILACSERSVRVVELDRDGKAVWEHNSRKAYQARRR